MLRVSELVHDLLHARVDVCDIRDLELLRDVDLVLRRLETPHHSDKEIARYRKLILRQIQRLSDLNF